MKMLLHVVTVRNQLQILRISHHSTCRGRPCLAGSGASALITRTLPLNAVAAPESSGMSIRLDTGTGHANATPFGPSSSGTELRSDPQASAPAAGTPMQV